MQVQIVGDGVEIDERIKQIVDEKIATELEKLLSSYDDDQKMARLRIQKEPHHDMKYKLYFEMILPGKNGKIYSDEAGDDLLNVIIALRKEVERQIKDYKEKLQDSR